MDKIQFGQIVSWISGRLQHTLSYSEVEDLNSLTEYRSSIVQAPVERTDLFTREYIGNQLQVLQDMIKRNDGQKIEAIKMHRMLTGWGLKESKDWVERWY